MNSSTSNNLNNDSINLSSIVKTVTSKWYLFVISVVACVGLALAYAIITPDKYIVESNVLIRTDMSSSNSLGGAFMQQMGFGALMGQGVSVDDEINIITSHSLFRETAVDMQLNKTHIYKKNFLKRFTQYSGYAIDVIDINNVCDTLGRTLNFKIKVDKDGTADIKIKKGFFGSYANVKDVQLPATINTIYGDFIVTTTPDYIQGEKYDYNVKVSGYDNMAEKIAKNIDIFLPDKLSSLIRLTIETPYVAYGKELLNTIVALYNERGITDKNIEASNTAKFIDERLAIIAKELDDAERKVESYKKENNLSDIEAEAKAMLENDMQFRARLLETETQVKILGYVLEFIARPENRFALVPFSADMGESASRAVSEYNQLALQRLNMSNTAKPGSPTLKMLEEQIDASRNNVIITIETSKESAEIALADLRAQDEKFMSRIKNMPTQEREFISIYRQKAIKEELYVFLLQKQEENAITLAMASPKGQIVDYAYNYNEPSSLSTFMLLFIGFVIGLVIPAVYLYLKAIFRTKFSTVEELQQITRLPVLGEVCINNSKEAIVVKDGENSPISELFRLLRTNLQFLLTGRNDKVVLVTSSISGEGKSFVSVNLALSLSLLKKRVVVIDLDIRNPRLSDYINIPARTGITNYLASEEMTVDQIINSSGVSNNLDVIVAGPIPPNPSELLLSNRLTELFDELRNRYDYIIIDSAPVAMVSDTFSLTRVSDTVVYVCRANYTQRDYIRYCNTLVTDERLRNVSLVVNATTAKAGYGYGYNQSSKRK